LHHAHAVDIAVTISSLIASLCLTFAEPFDDIFSSSSEVVHWSAEIQTKVYDPSIDRPTKRVNTRSLTKLLFRILPNSGKKCGLYTSAYGIQFQKESLVYTLRPQHDCTMKPLKTWQSLNFISVCELQRF